MGLIARRVAAVRRDAPMTGDNMDNARDDAAIGARDSATDTKRRNAMVCVGGEMWVRITGLFRPSTLARNMDAPRSHNQILSDVLDVTVEEVPIEL